jgi:hypothetical protein
LIFEGAKVFSFSSRGSFKNTESFLRNASHLNIASILSKYAQEGVVALASATPTESGLAAYSWGYEVSSDSGGFSITWTNSDVENGFPVAIMLQYGYGTGTGGYVAGRDYINPALRPIFDLIAEEVWKAVTSA